MSSLNKRTSASSSSSAKPPAAMGDAAKAPGATVEQAKKRVALGNITNRSNEGRNAVRKPGTKASNAKPNTASSTLTVKKGFVTSSHDTGLPSSMIPTVVKPYTIESSKATFLPKSNEPITSISSSLAHCRASRSPTHSGDSASLVESTSICDSMRSPDIEFMDNVESSLLASLERRTTHNLHISEHDELTGDTRKKGVPMMVETTDNIVHVDSSHSDPQFCARLASDIYKHLRIAETKKRPAVDFMERIQKDINPSMRAILIDWLVEVAEEYHLVPEALYLTVNYIDRYLSGNEIKHQQLQLLGVACMLIAAKYEEICAPQVEEFCFITDNTYLKDEVLQMEASVLKYLKFEITAPTIKCFLRQFVRAAQECNESLQLQLEFLANYLAELTLLEYSFLSYSPSLIAASSVLLAKFIMQPTRKPWNATLRHYTLYKPSELSECVKALHYLFCNSPNSNLPAIREKYCQHKYKFVAKKYCPPSIPLKYFQYPDL